MSGDYEAPKLVLTTARCADNMTRRFTKLVAGTQAAPVPGLAAHHQAYGLPPL